MVACCLVTIWAFVQRLMMLLMAIVAGNLRSGDVQPYRGSPTVAVLRSNSTCDHQCSMYIFCCLDGSAACRRWKLAESSRLAPRESCGIQRRWIDDKRLALAVCCILTFRIDELRTRDDFVITSCLSLIYPHPHDS
jgi:hypothetical protein